MQSAAPISIHPQPAMRMDKSALSSSGHPPSMGKIVESPEVGGLHHRYTRLAA
jgi:hypothetical protein